MLCECQAKLGSRWYFRKNKKIIIKHITVTFNKFLAKALYLSDLSRKNHPVFHFLISMDPHRTSNNLGGASELFQSR